MATIDDFKKLDIRVGKVLKVTPFKTLTLSVPDNEGNVVLLQPEREVQIGGKMY